MWCFSLSCPLYSIQTKVSIALCRHSKFQYLVLSGRNRTLHGTTRPSRQGDGLRHVCSKLKFDQSTVVLWIQKAVRFLQSETGQLGLFGLVCYLVLTGKISWIFDSFLIFFSVISILPVVGLLVFRWWVSKNVVQVFCPNCSTPVLGIKGREVACSNCGYLLTVEDHVVVAKDHSDSKTGSSKSNISVIDVDAREVGDE